MKAFTYKTATTEAEAVKLLGQGAAALAGGTSLLNLMKERILEPDVVVNLKTIKGLDKVEAAAGGVRIGANVTLVTLLEDASIRRDYPALAQAIDDLATPQIRNMATLGGNLCARPPCWYFSRDGYSCPKRGSGKDCAAKEGDNEFHAIFATDGPCVAVHASGTAPALLALGASVRVVGPGGERMLPLDQFFALPKADVTRENVLAPNEIVTHVMIPKVQPKSGTYIVLHKASHDWPVSQASVALEMDGGKVKSARIVLGAVAPVPWRAAAAEKAIAGQSVTEDTAAKAGAAAAEGAAPLSGNAYKLQTVKAAVKRALLKAATGKW
jgi:xanthine dehydrogenase YagS FAD-binding subunit